MVIVNAIIVAPKSAYPAVAPTIFFKMASTQQQMVVLDSGFATSNYKLFELDEPVLQEVLRGTGTVSIKGGPADDAVLCTADRTYTLRLAESSNTLLLAPERAVKRKRLETAAAAAKGEAAAAAVDEELRVQASVSAHFEILRCAPRTGGLLATLAACPYTGAIDTYDAVAADAAAAEGGSAAKKRPTLRELEITVQASAAELQCALRDAKALCVDGRWCVLETQLEADIMEAIISLCVEHEWPLASVPTAQWCARRESRVASREPSQRGPPSARIVRQPCPSPSRLLSLSLSRTILSSPCRPQRRAVLGAVPRV